MTTIRLDLRERFRAWLHRECRLEKSRADAMLEVSQRLGELGRYSHELTRAVVERPERVTVFALGERTDQPEPPVVIDTKTQLVRSRDSETFVLEASVPIKSFQVMVIANLELVDVRGIFQGTSVLTLANPIAFGVDWHPGHQVRVICNLREPGR